MKLTLKVKLTITSVIILTLMCLILTLTAIYAANLLTEAVDTAPAQISGDVVVPQPSSELSRAATTNFRFTVIYTMLALIGIGTILTYLFARKTLKPLEQLTKTADQINIHCLEENIPLPNTGDEVERLTQSFNDMTTKLHASYQVQKNFSANAAHELRTPLAAIQTQLEVFNLKTDRNADEYAALIQRVGKSTERLSMLVNDLLRFTNHQTVDRSKPVDLYDLFTEIIFELEDKARAKNVELLLSGTGTVYGDDGLLQRAFYNLVSNAIGYNVEGGKVIITISSHEIHISDTGIGIPDEAKANIFNTFFCVDKSRSRQLGGSGLGLAIVKNIIEKHDGYLYVKDNHPQGSIFIIGFMQPTN
ncbi:MAG: ATP-binding protein [Anaerovoracaceae bacterium]